MEIKNETEYQEALKLLEALFDAKPGTKAGADLEVLVSAIMSYENKN